MAGHCEHGLASSVCNALGSSRLAQDLRPAPDQRPARDQRPPRTWLAVLHQLIGLLIGALSFPLVLAGVTVGAVLAPIGGSGLPILGLTLRYTDGLAAIERSRFAGMAGREVPPWPADPRRRYRWLVIPGLAAFTGRATWGKICYPLPRLLASALLFPIVVAFWAVGLATLPLTAPFYLWTNPLPALEDGRDPRRAARPGGPARPGGAARPDRAGGGGHRRRAAVRLRAEGVPQPRARGRRPGPVAAVAPGRPGRPGHRARDQPRAGGGRGRGRAAPDRARPARRRPAAPGGAGDGARPGQGEVRRRPRGRQGCSSTRRTSRRRRR